MLNLLNKSGKKPEEMCMHYGKKKRRAHVDPTPSQILGITVFVWTVLFIVIAFFSGAFGILSKVAQMVGGA